MANLPILGAVFNPLKLLYPVSEVYLLLKFGFLAWGLTASATTGNSAKQSPPTLDPHILQNFIQSSVLFLVALNFIAFLFLFLSLYRERIKKLEKFFPKIRIPILIPSIQFAKSKAKTSKPKPVTAEPSAASLANDLEAPLDEGPDTIETPPETLDSAEIHPVESAPSEDVFDAKTEELDTNPPPPLEEAVTDAPPPPPPEDEVAEVVAAEPDVESEAVEPEASVTEEIELPEEAAAPEATEEIVEEVVEEVVETPPPPQEEVVEEIVEEVAAAPTEEPQTPAPDTSRVSTPGEIIGSEAEEVDADLAAMVAAAADSTGEIENSLPTEEEVVEEVIEEVVAAVETQPPPPPAPIEEVAKVEEVIEEMAASSPPPPEPKQEEIPVELKALGDDVTEVIPVDPKIRLDDELENALNAPISETEEIPVFDLSALDDQIDQETNWN